MNYYNNNTLMLNDIKDGFYISNKVEKSDKIFKKNDENNFYKYFEEDQIPSSIPSITNKNNSYNFLSDKSNDKDNLLINFIRML